MRTRAWRRRWLGIERVWLVEWGLQFFQWIQRKGHRDGGSGRAAWGLRILFTRPHLWSTLFRDVAVGSWPRKKDCRAVRRSWTRSGKSRQNRLIFLDNKFFNNFSIFKSFFHLINILLNSWNSFPTLMSSSDGGVDDFPPRMKNANGVLFPACYKIWFRWLCFMVILNYVFQLY